MPVYEVTKDGVTLELEGDQPPTKDQLDRIFSQYSPQPVDYQFGETVRNLPGSLLNVGKQVAHAAMSPIDTAAAMGDLVGDTVNKVALEVTGLITGSEPPDNMPGMDTSSFDALANDYINAYGSSDAFKRTLMEDPARVLVDFLGVAAPASKIPGMSRLSTVTSAVEPVQAISKGARTVGKGAAQLIPEKKLTDAYKRSAKFTTTKDDAARTRMAETALREGVIPNEKGVIAIQDRINNLGAQIDTLISDATKSGKRIPVDAVFQHLNELRGQRGGLKLEASTDLSAIDDIARTFRQHVDSLGRSYFTPDELQAFKRDIYSRINFDARNLQGTPVKVDTRKAVARGAKDAIANAVQGVPELNKQLGELLELQPHLERAANRIGNRNPIGLTTPLNVGAGSIAGEILGSGGAGMAAGSVVAAINNPKMAARIAVALKKLKDNDVNWLEANSGRQDVRIALMLASQANEIIGQAYDQ